MASSLPTIRNPEECNASADGNSASSTLSCTHSVNLHERFCDDPFQLGKWDERVDRCLVSPKFVDQMYDGYSEEKERKIHINNISEARQRKIDKRFQMFLQTVNQAANEIRIVGKEREEMRTAHKMSCDLLDMKDKDEQTILEYCVKLYTTSSFVHRACHRDLCDYYSSDDKKLSHYIKLLNRYITHYGKSYNGTLYRGAQLDDEKLKLSLTNDIDTKWYSLSYLSTSKSRQIAEIYGNVLFIINIPATDYRPEKAIDISKLSVIPDEEEVLIMPKYSFFREKEFEYDRILNKHIVYLTSTCPMYRPNREINDYRCRRTRSKLQNNSVPSVHTSSDEQASLDNIP